MKPHIRKIRATNGPVYECCSVHAGKGSPDRGRYGFGKSIREAYESWLSKTIKVGDWA